LKPVFYLLAGPNGAGKSTLYRSALASGLLPVNAEFVNADLHEASALQHITDPQERSAQARAWADARRSACLLQGLSFVSETVFSHPSKLDLMREARAAGFAVVLLVVCVNDPHQLLGRVAQRVAEGGHDVPPERILARYPRTLQHLKEAIPLADLALLYDTSGVGRHGVSGSKLVARWRHGQWHWQVQRPPAWARKVQPAAPQTPTSLQTRQ
jgi:predicted ABC-type ATPase